MPKKQLIILHWTDAAIEGAETIYERDLENVGLIEGIAVGVFVKEDKKSITLAIDWFYEHNSYRQVATYPKSGIHKIIRKDINLERKWIEMKNYGSRDGHGKGRGMPGGGRRNQNPNPCGRGGRGVGRGTNRK